MKYTFIAAAVLVAAFAAIHGGRAAEAQRPPLTIRMTCDDGVSASSFVFFPNGGSDSVACGSNDVSAGGERPRSIEFVIDVSAGGASNHCEGEHRVPARIVCTVPGSNLGATLTVK